MKLSLTQKVLGSALLSAILIGIAGMKINSKVMAMLETERWVIHTNEVIASFNGITSLMVDMETGERGYLMSGQTNFLEPYNRASGLIDEKILKLKSTVSDNPTQVGRLDKVMNLKNQWLSQAVAVEMDARKKFDQGTLTLAEFSKIMGEGKGKVFMDSIRSEIGAAIAMEDSLNQQRKKMNEQTVQEAKNLIIYGLSAAVFVGLICLLLVTLNVSKVMNQVTNLVPKLADVTSGVNEATQDIASSSHQLSQSSTESAASIQQVVSSIAELSGTVSRSAENANTSAQVTRQGSMNAQAGQRAVNEMIQSVEEIDKSTLAIASQIEQSNQEISEIAKVIKEIDTKTRVINDIVFQTKLLSFNASVEAARAGEHGKGFAVVAEEIGNLAQMSGSAAKEISQMLSTSVTTVETIVASTRTKLETLTKDTKACVEKGINVSKSCGELLVNVVNDVSEAEQMANDIANSCKEQSTAVGEVNAGMLQMDTVTQQNASVATMTAHAAEKLTAQSSSLNEIVEALSNIVGTKTSVDKTKNNTDSTITKIPNRTQFKMSA